MVIVKNNTPSLHGIAYKDPKRGSVSVCRLMPGSNEIEDEIWDALSTHPRVQWRVDNKQYELIETSANKGIRGLTPKKATSLIKETYDNELLGKWRSEETRTTVLKAIDEQMEFMSLPPREDV